MVERAAKRRCRVAAAILFAFQICGDAQASEPADAAKGTKNSQLPTQLPPQRPPGLAVHEDKPEDKRPSPEPDRPTFPTACTAAFSKQGGVALPTAPDTGSDACAIAEPVTFRLIAMPDGGSLELDSAVTVACAFALEIVGWVRDDLPGVIAREHGKPAKLMGVGGHACRPRNGTAGAPISEHATGNALDLGGLRLEDGRTIGLVGGDPATRSLREALKQSACARFRTVLGPGSDSSHQDHLHLDMRQRPRDFRICQWDIE